MKSILFLFGSLFSILTLASTSAEEVFNRNLKKYSLDKANLGVIVSTGEGDHSKIILSVNSEKKMIPASLTKIVTASGVLEHYLPGSKFKTQLLLDARPISKKIPGPLYLKGGGDPAFVSENLWFLVNYFKRSGVEIIDGDIVVDDSLFDDVRFDESRQDARVDRAYDAPVGAMSFNWNSVNVFVRPSKSGEKAHVILDPENEYTILENRTKTVTGKKINIEVSRGRKGMQDVLTVNGTIGGDVVEHVIYKNITRPDLWSGHQLRSFLLQRGIKVTGGVRNGRVPSKAVVVAESESKPVEDIVADMNKFSNNYVAEMLCKNLGLKKGQPGTIENGMQVLRDHLKQIGVKGDHYELYNPSGLTRDNKMTPVALWQVLKHLREDFRVQPELLKSLPIAGVDGTLKRRMKGSSAERWVRAKTGLLTGVAALGGYAGRKRDGETLTFVLIYNGSADDAKVRQFYDDLLVELVD